MFVECLGLHVCGMFGFKMFEMLVGMSTLINHGPQPRLHEVEAHLIDMLNARRSRKRARGD